MLKSQFRNRINKDKISRYSSQLALRKSLVQCNTPKQSDNTELSNIKKTTFWMKKTLNPQGMQNLPPNCKRMNSSRNGQSLSIKMLTKNSQQNSICYKNIQSDKQSDSRIAIIQKYQKQLIQQTKILLNQQIPKLSNCNKIFYSLNKSIKIIINSCSKSINQKFINIFNHHLDTTYLLFLKIISYNSEFVKSNQSSLLIGKNIQLEKQNQQLRNLQFQHQVNDFKEFQEKINQKIKNPENSFIKYIDYQRVLLTNCRVSDFRPTPSKPNQLYTTILKPYMNLTQKKQLGKFELVNHIIKNLTQSRQSNTTLKKLVNDIKNKKPYTISQKTKNYQSISRQITIDILLYKFNYQYFQTIKNKLLKLNNLGYFKYLNQNKFSIKQILHIFNKFSIINNLNQIKLIISYLLTQCQLKTGQKLTDKQLIEINCYLDQNTKQLLQNINVEIIQKNSIIAEYIAKTTKINSISNKRFINCASLYQSKNIKTTHASKKNSIHCFNTEIHDHRMQIYPFVITDNYVDEHQVLMLIYVFVIHQLEYLEITTFTLLKIAPQPQTLVQFNKILQKLMNKSIYDKLQFLHRNEKQAILEINQRLLKVYDNDLREQYIKLSIIEMFNYIKLEILTILNGDQKKILLNHLIIDNNKAETFLSTQIHAFDQIQIK